MVHHRGGSGLPKQCPSCGNTAAGIVKVGDPQTMNVHGDTICELRKSDFPEEYQIEASIWNRVYYIHGE